jgi:hypothetical protein
MVDLFGMEQSCRNVKAIREEIVRIVPLEKLTILCAQHVDMTTGITFPVLRRQRMPVGIHDFEWNVVVPAEALVGCLLGWKDHSFCILFGQISFGLKLCF